MSKFSPRGALWGAWCLLFVIIAALLIWCGTAHPPMQHALQTPPLEQTVAQSQTEPSPSTESSPKSEGQAEPEAILPVEATETSPQQTPEIEAPLSPSSLVEKTVPSLERTDITSAPISQMDVAVPQAPALDTSHWPMHTYSKKAAYMQTDPSPPMKGRIAVVVMGGGLDEAAAHLAIDQLPPPVTIAFSSYAAQIEALIQHANQKGHKVLVLLPMEPDLSLPNNPGPLALLSSLPVEKNLERLKQALSHAEGVVGVTHMMGNTMAASRDTMQPILKAIQTQGLLWLDPLILTRSLLPTLTQELGVTYLAAVLTLDEEVSKVGILKNLKILEEIALKEGQAIAVASSYPLSLKQISEWAQHLKQKGIELVPLTALISPLTPQASHLGSKT